MEVIINKVNTDLDGFDIYSLFKNEKNSAILDSAKYGDGLGRYSFIGINSFLNVKSYGKKCWINGQFQEKDVFQCLKDILKNYKIINETDLPFISGGIGYFSYDLGREIEVIPNTALEDIVIPHCYYNFYDNIIIFDNQLKETYITALGILKDKYESIAEIEEKIKHGKKVEYDKEKHERKIDIYKKAFNSNFTKEEYIKSVEKVREYIRTGDVYITNLTQRFWCNTEKKPYEVYKKLRYINPAPFAAFINCDDFTIISSSPERFLSIRNDIVETRPIKGTRPRGDNVYEDENNKKELLNSEKDKSELLMIVDLERNDLSKVCIPNSVRATELFKLEEYSTVFHLVSTIVGEIKEEHNCIDCIKACFPGGSITGAPKIRSMEIIEELEGIRRNVYTGAIGYIGFDESVDLNIVIRTILMKERKAYFGVGGGITWESNSISEYEETLDKAKALMEALS
ncbi:aminodeoxychorismate synthase component 1 [Clostridium tepidiprofundi DSM 19306]|uniref:Anthranilate synthase component 1 n=1 Tax=Clostridium tepidiprofundi DSM 19306 TaxID=1121338 RepID=A0A151B573_9CLOT|nr:aminodeoxychorismate synthase component I [Clostridium tepidiprofundi]KYH35036.1 aminodeoxychorismate synthase component 1 [Clostridium tepidiprofundi DSM 19306]